MKVKFANPNFAIKKQLKISYKDKVVKRKIRYENII